MAMKSLGQRLVAGLKNWRSRKKDISPEEMPDSGSIASEGPKQSDHEMAKQQPIKATATDADEADTMGPQPTEPVDLSEALTPSDQPQASVKAISRAEPLPGAETKDIAPAASVAPKPVQKRSRAKKAVTKATDGSGADAGSAVLDGKNAQVDKKPDNDGIASDGGAQLNNISALVTAPDQDQEGGNIAGTTEPESPSEAFAQADKLQEEPTGQAEPVKEEGTDQTAATHAALASPRKRSPAGKSKSSDELVTNRELASLEAENARLKQLLSEKLLVKRVDPEN
ncbi:hypothetical protein DKP76_16505 [Falsochrobactrum shanghaiense]|uniref:Uncharacterized protein n=1 Tax=Falsochrobactrum shanghaiense TaxID=2201899 RepID=A0A316J735_9HYPH|nr:hypothetical protein [Falsochrobactrum shanghaiense]PWL16575.1 hypothetical protein DKP76_16505 [Falsochrobactrum shanghaiense]